MQKPPTNAKKDKRYGRTDGQTNRHSELQSCARATKNVVRRKGWGKLPRILTYNIVLTIFSTV